MTFDKNNTTVAPFLLIKAGPGTDRKRLEHVRSQLDNLIVDSLSEDKGWLQVSVDPDQIFLSSSSLGERVKIGVSFHGGASNHRRLYGGGKSQHLAKAVGADQRKGLSILDATAGLGGDSFVLACLGAKVQMLERNPVLALMLRDALLAAKNSDDTGLGISEIIDRMSIVQEDSIQWLARQPVGVCEVVLLDPMFPERKKKAAVKKEMQILQHLLRVAGESESERSEEAAALLQMALARAARRVVVKRPRHAPPLPGEKPAHCIQGKSTRFDIYPLKKIGSSSRQ